VLLDRDQALVRAALTPKDAKGVQAALATVQAVASAAHASAPGLLLPILKDKKAEPELRRQATRPVAKTQNGARQLLGLARAKQLPKELEPAAGSALVNAPWKDVKAQAVKLFPLPPGKDRPLPTISELVKQRGDAGRGRNVFANAGTCAKCHVVNGEGKEVG